MMKSAPRARWRAVFSIVLFGLVAMQAGRTAFGQTNYYWDGSNTANSVPDGGIGQWDDLLVNWRDQLLAGGNEVMWTSGANSIANFGNPTTANATSNVTLASSVTLNTINFTNNTGNNYSINTSNGSTITFQGANPTIGMGTGSQNTTSFITAPVISSSQLNVIDDELALGGAPVFNFSNDLDSFTGGVFIDSPLKSPLFNFVGTTDPKAIFRVNFNTNHAAGAQGAAAGDITIAANGMRFSNANTAAGLVRDTYNHIILNPGNLPNFVIAVGATNASGGGAQNTLNYIGDISGNASVIIGNDVVWESGGAAFTVFSGTKKTYTGLTIMNGSTAAVFKIGADNVLPDGNVMQFGAIPTGLNSANPGATGALDLNGHVLTIAALRTMLTNTNSNTTAPVNGITNTAAGQATLIINGSTADTYGGGIGITANNLTAGAGIATDNVALTRTGTGSTTIGLTLGGNSTSTYFGPTNVNGSASLIAGSTTGFSKNSDYTVAGDNSFGGSGIATLDLNGFNNTINSLSGTASGVVTNNSGLANAVLTIGNSANSHNPTPTATFSGVIQDGSGGNTLALTKAGGGTQTLAATNSYSGPTVVNAGTLSLAATGSIATGSAVTVNANGTLAGTGNAFGSVELKSSGAIAPGTTATTGTLNVGSVQFDGGSIYSFKIKDAGDVGMAIPPITDSLLSTGAITLDSATVAPGNAVVIKLSSFGAPPTHFNSANNYSWQLAQGSALAGAAFDPSLFSVNSIGFKGASPFATFNVSNPNPGVLELNYVAGTAPANLSWVGPLGTGGDGSWDSAGGTNWNDGVMNTGWNSANAADFNQGSGTVTLSAPISVPFIKFDVDGYTIAGTGGNTLSATMGFNTLAVQVTNAGQTGTISASIASSLTLIGSGTLVLTGNNNFGGAPGTVNVNGGTLQGNVSSLGGNGANTSSTNITNNATVVFDQAVDATYAGTMDGSGTLVKQNVGKLMLTGNNSYSGGTTISGGTLRVTSDANLGAAGGTLTFNGGTLNMPGVTTARPVVVTAAAGSILDDTGTNGTPNVFSGGATFAAGGVLTKTGSGILQIKTTAWGGSGGLVIGGGSLLVGDPTDANSNPSAFLGGNALTLNNGTTLTIAAFSDAAGSITPPSLTLNGNVTIGLYKTGGLGGMSPTLNSTTTISGGIITVNASAFDANNGLTNSTVTLGATTFNGDATIQTVAAGSGGAATGIGFGAVTDNGHALTFLGQGHASAQVDPGSGVTIGAVNDAGRTESGNWTIGDAAGLNAQVVTLNAQHALHPEYALTTGNVTVNSGSQLDVASLSTTAIYGPDMGMQTITLNGAGPADATIPNQFHGALFVASRAQPVFNSNVHVVFASNTQISLDNSNALIPTLLTFNGPVTGGGTLTLTAGDTQGELFFSGNNNLTGGTIVKGGKLVVNGVGDMLPDSSMGTGDLTMAQAGSQQTDVILFNTAQSIGNLSSVYAGSMTAVSQEIHLHGTVLSITQTTNADYGISLADGATAGGSDSRITSTGSIVLTAASTAELSLSSSHNSYTGSTTIQGGSLAIWEDVNASGDPGNLGTAPSMPTTDQLVIDGGQFHATRNPGVLAPPAAPVVLDPNRGVTIGPNGGTIKTDDGAPLTVQGPTKFLNAAHTLNIAAASSVKFIASTNAASVASGSSVTIATNATIELAGTASALSDGTNNVNVVNNSNAAGGGLHSTGTNQNVGFVSGTGDTAVAAGSDLTADGIIQNSLMIGGSAGNIGHVTIRASSDNTVMAANPAGTVGALAVAGSLTPTSPFGSDNGGSSNAMTASGAELVSSAGFTTSSVGGNLGGGSAAVPEPATWLLTVVAAGGLLSVARRKNRSNPTRS